MPTSFWITLSGLLLLAIAATWVSIDMLCDGWLYQRMEPSSRPRRWVLIWLLAALGVCIAWLPFMIFLPNAWITQFLLKIVGIVFVVVALTLRNFGWLVNWVYSRKGWRLR
jgi:hypothetical protein